MQRAIAGRMASLTTDLVPRKDIASVNKLLSEGTPNENIITLGYSINSRAFTNALPDNKHDAWSHQISEILR